MIKFFDEKTVDFLTKIGSCLQHLLLLTTMEHVLVNMLKNVEHKQKLVSKI